MSETVKNLKPKMKVLPHYSLLPLKHDTVVMAKADGEFNAVYFNRNGVKSGVQSENMWATLRLSRDLPCLRELEESCYKAKLEKATFLAELYAVDDGKMLQLPKLIHHIRAGDKNLIHLGIFDLLEVNDRSFTNEDYSWKISEVRSWLEGWRHADVLPYIVPETADDVEKFWKHYVEELNFEGIVARNGEWTKIKRNQTVDAVIIGINKKPLTKDTLVTSLKVGLKDADGNIVELSDVASGIDHGLRATLWKLTDFKVREDDKTIWIKPLVVVEIGYIELFQSTRTVLDADLHKRGTKQFYSLRSPKLLSIRSDKKPTADDIGESQLGGY